MTNKMRRVYLAQYSVEVIRNADGGKPWGNADAFLKDGKNIGKVAEPATVWPRLSTHGGALTKIGNVKPAPVESAALVFWKETLWHTSIVESLSVPSRRSEGLPRGRGGHALCRLHPRYTSGADHARRLHGECFRCLRPGRADRPVAGRGPGFLLLLPTITT